MCASQQHVKIHFHVILLIIVTFDDIYDVCVSMYFKLNVKRVLLFLSVNVKKSTGNKY